MEVLWQDIRVSLRSLRRSPGFTATAIITLALGIGANTAIFSVINGVLLSPPPYAEPDRLVYVNTTSGTFGPGLWPMPAPIFADFLKQNDVLEAMSATRKATLNFTEGEQTDRVEAARVSANTLRLLGLRPALGRDFADGEDMAGATPVAILTHRLWQARFGGRGDVLNQLVSVDGVRYTIVGVLPPGLAFPEPDTALWIPLILAPAESNLSNFILQPFGRLRAGISIREADAQMKTIAARLAKEYPAGYGTAGVQLMPINDRLVGSIRPALWILFGAVGCVLLIACVNIANLLLARASSRSSELAIRSALGADRIRLLRQLITESLLLSLMGAALGLLLGTTSVRFIVGIAGAAIPRASEIHLDAKVLFFTLVLGVLTGILFGLFPALRLSHESFTGSLRESGRKGGTRGAAFRRALGTLVVAEVAMSLILLAGAGLTLRSFARLQRVNVGFSADRMMTFEMGASRANYPSNDKQAEFYRRVVEQVRALPGVESAAAGHRVPLVGMATTGFQVEGRLTPPGAPGRNADIRAITTEFFATMRIPVRRGRDFTERDVPGAPDVVVVSESLARREWPDENPIGKRIQIGGLVNRWWEVVGVVGDVRYRGLDQDNAAAIYWTLQQQGFPNALRAAFLIVRTKTEPLSMVTAIRDAVQGVDRQEGLAGARTMEEIISSSIGRHKMNLSLLLVFAGIAAVLAAIGIYGVMSYSVTQRTQEIGIRMALGATAGDVRGMMLRQGMVLAAIGVIVGVAGTLALSRVIQTLLYNLPGNDPSTIVAVAALLGAVALLATYLPAHRASRVDPIVALRSE